MIVPRDYGSSDLSDLCDMWLCDLGWNRQHYYAPVELLSLYLRDVISAGRWFGHVKRPRSCEVDGTLFFSHPVSVSQP